MNIALWIVQALLAVAFGMAGGMKTFVPLEEIAKNLPWVLEYPPAFTRFIGVSELAGAVGLVLPSVTRIQPRLTVLAAYGLAVVMALAMGFHAMRGEFLALPPNLVLMSMALFVAWGRTAKAPIEAKGG